VSNPFSSPDKKLFSELMALAGDFHTFQLAYIRAKAGTDGPPTLEELVKAILAVKKKPPGTDDPQTRTPLTHPHEVGT
jgi:hypothetical protein